MRSELAMNDKFLAEMAVKYVGEQSTGATLSQLVADIGEAFDDIPGEGERADEQWCRLSPEEKDEVAQKAVALVMYDACVCKGKVHDVQIECVWRCAERLTAHVSSLPRTPSQISAARIWMDLEFIDRVILLEWLAAIKASAPAEPVPAGA